MDTEKLLAPFWEGKEVYDESIMLLSENGKEAYAPLFYKPLKILSVKSADLKNEYKEGTDWEIKDGKIVRTKTSAMPFMNKEELHFAEKKDDDCFEGKNGGYVLYKNKGYFHKRQVVVTYTHNDSCNFGIEKQEEGSLKRIKALLEKGEAIKMCFYGDSITAGCDGSGAFGIEPFMPGWPKLFAGKLEEEYGSKIEIINTAVGGKRSDWGLECAEERLAEHKADLAVIAFGMNDGTEKVSPEAFGENIRAIMDKAIAKNKDIEFILIATTLANPESVFDYNQKMYYNELLRCKRDMDAVLNMTKIHSVLLARKRFVDMTGNNINHPNDFLIRIYAQAMIDLFR